MINFKVIRWQNLLSTGNIFTEVRLDKTRTTLIIGTNGSGKSTILDAITFVLFNKPFRKINKGQLINSITGKNLLVEIEFDKGGSEWLVRRGSKPNLFEIYRNGELVDQNAENKDYQAYLENVLGMNQKAFSQVVILGAASFVPFMQLTVPARREVIEDLLDIQVFSDMNVLLKARVSANKDALSKANQELGLALNKLEMAEEFNRKQSEGQQHIITSKQAKIEQLTTAALETIAKLEAAEGEIQIIDGDTEALNQEKRQLEDKLLTLRNEVANRRKMVKFFTDHENCPTCKQGIEHEFRRQEIDENQEAIDVRKAEEGIYLEAIKDIDARLDEIFEHTKRVKKHEALIGEYNREVVWYQQQVESLTAEIAVLEKANQKSLVDLEPLKMAVKDKTSTLEVRNEHTKVLDAAAILLKDSGIKSVIIKQYIPVINTLINKYLATLDFFVDFQINEAFEETIKSRFRDEFSYESFSEGEKQRIDLAILFAWRAVAKMRNSASCNILFFDEILDGSMDQDGQGAFTKILENMVDHENIFIISHNIAIGDSFDAVLKFSKVQGYSKLVEA